MPVSYYLFLASIHKQKTNDKIFQKNKAAIVD